MPVSVSRYVPGARLAAGVTISCAVPPGATAAGVKLQVALAAASPLRLSETASEKPLTAVTETA